MEPVDDTRVLRQAFERCVDSIEYFISTEDMQMVSLKIEVAKQLLHLPAVPSLALDLTFQRAIRRFRALSIGVPVASLDQREVIEHGVQNALAEARQKLFPPTLDDLLERIRKESANGPFILG